MDNSLLNDDGYKKQIIAFGIAFLLIILLIVVLIVNHRKEDYIIINKSLILTKSGSKYKQINKLDDSVLDFEYNVYSKGNVYKDVSIKIKDNVWYFFDKDYNDLNLNLVPAAYTKKFEKIKVADYKTTYYDEDDDSYLSKIAKGKLVNNFKDSLMKTSYDLDGDGITETIYTINNYGLTSSSRDSYSSVFLVKGDTLIGELSSDHRYPYIVQSVIDLDGNGKYEVIVSKGTIDMATFDTCYQIYSIKGKKIKLIKDC
ncbi:MAG: hypothetical protein IKG27_04575 [Bacilli bacterium]|nr:hypothetical protein [Bacilli bacterium]